MVRQNNAFPRAKLARHLRYAVLDLPQALQSIYDEAAYDLSIDYRQSPPPPPCSETDRQWMHELVEQL